MLAVWHTPIQSKLLRHQLNPVPKLLSAQSNAVSHLLTNRVLLDDVEKSASLMDKFCNSEPLEAVDRLVAQMGQRQVRPTYSLRSVSCIIHIR